VIDAPLINRRNFIKASALAGGGLLVYFSIPRPVSVVTKVTLPPSLSAFDAVLKIGNDNSVNIFLSKVEMGQGIWTTLPMLIAEELDCDLAQIEVQAGPPGNSFDFDKTPAFRSTGGSETTVSEFDHYRQVGAVARTMLIHAAANRMGLSSEKCRAENGYVIAGGSKISYGELAGEAAQLPVSAVTLKQPAQWKLIGKSQKRLDTPIKINGKARYGIDVQFPGLLTAVVAHAPVFGSKMVSMDATKAKAVIGVVDVIEVPTGVAVLADHFWAAKKGRDALEIVWDREADEHLDSERILENYAALAVTPGAVIEQRGDVGAALKKAHFRLEAEFRFPFLAHSPMEPLNCTVRLSEGQCEIWTGTQSPLPHQQEVAALLGIKPEKVLLHTPFIGGSFGRRGSFNADWIIEAVHIARKSQRPVKLIQTREDDVRGGYYRPIYLHRAEIGVGKDGVPVAWRHRIVGQSLFEGTPLSGLIVQNGIDWSSVTTGAPYTGQVADRSFELHTTRLPVPVLAWRSVGSTHTVFVIETLIDELASLAQKDPVEYRRHLLKGSPRHLAALNMAAEKARWDDPLPVGRFRGVAVCEAMGSYLAQVAEISLENSAVKVHKVVCAIDCGLAVNPDGVRAQMEGGIIYGLTAALYGEITLENGRVKQSNFHDYQIMRMKETPLIEVHIVPGTEKMGGAGEPGVAPIAAALANAIFSATGKRIRRLPIGNIGKS